MKKKFSEIQYAGYQLLQEEALDYAIQSAGSSNYLLSGRILVYLECIGTFPVIAEVFNPEKPIQIGRNPRDNTICLDNETISGQHCRIFLQDGVVMIQDLGSKNHTIVKRRFRSFPLNGGEYITLQAKDRIMLGSLELYVCIFQFDPRYVIKNK